MDFALLVGLGLGAIVGFALATARQASLIARAKSAEEKLGYAEERMAEHFESLSAKALDASNQRFLELADTRLKAAGAEAAGELERRKQAVEHLVAPLRDTLAKVEEQLREVEIGRRESHAMLAKQVDFVRQRADELRAETQTLVRALQRPEARGRWGELQLRRVVEIAGMTHHCDFAEQVTAVAADGVVRPDLVVRLAGEKNIVVDAKVSLAAYLEAASADDETLRSARLDAHARHLRDHVDRLAAKSYWQAFSPAPEFVVLFIPGEVFLAPALDRSPELLEYAMRRRVHIATPTTLITMLRTAHYAWQQAALSRNARAVFEVGKELYERLGTMGRHVDELGKSLAGAISAYNRTVGSLESRVLVSARRLTDLGVVDGDLEVPRPVEETPRALSATELLDDDHPAPPALGHQPGNRPAPQSTPHPSIRRSTRRSTRRPAGPSARQRGRRRDHRRNHRSAGRPTRRSTPRRDRSSTGRAGRIPLARDPGPAASTPPGPRGNVMISTTERAAPAGAPSTPRGAMRRRSSGPSITLTGRGGVVVIFAVTLLGALLGAESLLDVSALPGLSFVIGCVLAAVATRRADLLVVAASPPLIFFVAMLVASIAGAFGDSSLLRSVFVGLVTALTAGAPWLFLGTLLVLAIAVPRGLLTDLRELRARLRAEPRPWSTAAGRRTEDPDDDPVRWDEPH